MIQMQPNTDLINQCSEILIAKNLTIAFAESATGGRIASEYAVVADAGKFLKGGIVCYDASVKKNVLRVEHDLIEKFTPESPEVTQAIALGLERLFDAALLIGCTGLTNPGGSETEQKPVGTMFFYGSYRGKKIFKESKTFQGDAQEIICCAVDHFSILLLKFLDENADEKIDMIFNQDKTKVKSSVKNSGNGFDDWSVSWP